MDIGTLKPLEVSRTATVTPQAEPRVEQDSATAVSVQSVGKTPATQVGSAPEADQPRAIEKDTLQDVVETIQDFVQSVSRNINFQLDDSSGRMIVNVTERNTGELIRQIPSEEALQLAENLSEIRSLLFKAEA
jgi:flagellar protein FlaG